MKNDIEEILGLDAAIDQAGWESFPASDPPAWSPTHAGAPAGPRAASADPLLLYEVVQQLRDDIRTLAHAAKPPREDGRDGGHGGIAAVTDAIEARMTEAGAPVKRRALGRGLAAVEAVFRGEVKAVESLVITAASTASNADDPGVHGDPSAMAVLLALARGLRGLSVARTVRLVALSSGPPGATSAAYFDTLEREGPQVFGMIDLAGPLGLPMTPVPWPMGAIPMLRSEVVLTGLGRRSRALLGTATEAFERASPTLRVGAVTLPRATPGFLIRPATAAAALARRGGAAVVVSDVGPLWWRSDGERYRSRDHDAKEGLRRLDIDRLGRTTSGLLAAVYALASAAVPLH